MNSNNQPRPQVRPTVQPVKTAVTARVNDYLGALPQPNSEAEGLVRGLAHFNSSLNGVYDRMLADKQEAERKKAEEDRVRANAAAQHATSGQHALRSDEPVVDGTTPVAVDSAYYRSYQSALAKRAAIETGDEMTREYEAQKDTEGFNVDTFIQDSRRKALAGVKSEVATAVLGEDLSRTEAAIRAQAQTEAVRRHGEERAATASALTRVFTKDMTPEQIAERYHSWYVPQAGSIQVSKKAAAGMLLNRVKALSDEAGGRPDLFTVFDEKDSEGFTILDRNPQLADHIASERAQAQRARDLAHKDAKQPGIARLLLDYDNDIRDTPERITADRVVEDVKSGDISAEKAAALYHQAQEELGKKKALVSMSQDASSGMLGFYDPKDQGKVLDQMLGTTARRMWQAATSGDQQTVQGLAQYLTQQHSMTGATVPVETLARLMDTSVTNLPAAEGPSEKFLASVEVYRALAADQKYRSLYFKGDTDEVMAAYVKHRDGGADAKTAYTAAYRAIDPAFKEQSKKRSEAPAMQDKIRSLASKYATGSTMWGWLGGNGRPENELALGMWAATEVRRIVELNPDLTDKELHDHIERKASQNFVLDTTSQLAVKVPPPLSGDLTQKSVSAFSKHVAEQLGPEGFPQGSIVRYVPLNAEGTYEVQVWNGSRSQRIQTAQLQDIINWHRASTTLSQDEGLQLSTLRQAMRAGKALPQVDPALLAKGRSVGFFKDSELAAVQKANRDQVMARLRAVPDFGFGKPANTASPLPVNPNVKFDPKTTTSVALELAASPVTARGFEHVGLASSLIAMREGVSLTAYPDPNPEAGMNIGAGYNLKANAANVDSDLKRAGVPVDRIADVKTGKASLTPDQAKRLIEVAAPRYEESARKSAEATAPGLWTRMTAAQRAVMVDIAYQVGDPAQFKKAWAALAAGKTQEFSDETRVSYRNKAGVMVEDTRARELRASMLSGVADWNARVSMAAK
nr:hypothetical protein [uncultured Roseateles sp.]